MMKDFNEDEKQGFDLTVHRRDPRTGELIDVDPYTVRVVGHGGTERSRYFERPSGSGNLWDKNGNPVGRWDKTKPEGERFLAGVPHIHFEKPLTADQLLKKEMIESKTRIAELEKELASVKNEKEPKSQKAPASNKG